jgi:hypothetical protein
MQQLRQVKIHVRTLASRRTRALVVSDERRSIALGVNSRTKLPVVRAQAAPEEDKMFTTMAERHGRQMLDLGTLDLLNSG